MNPSARQQYENLKAPVQTSHVRGVAINQLNHGHPTAESACDLEKDQTRQTKPAPSLWAKDCKLKSSGQEQTAERTPAFPSQLPLDDPSDMKRDLEDHPISARLEGDKTAKIEPASEHPSVGPLLNIPSMVSSASCLQGSTKGHRKRSREDTEPLPEARRRKGQWNSFNHPVTLSCHQSYTLKKFHCRINSETGRITAKVTWEESEVPWWAFAADGTWQEFLKHLERQFDCPELLPLNPVPQMSVDENEMGEYMVSQLKVSVAHGQLVIKVSWADSDEPLSLLDRDARKTAKKQFIREYGRDAWRLASSKRTGI